MSTKTNNSSDAKYGRFRYFQSGLQLIELLIGLAIVGVLASIIIPVYTGFLKAGEEAEGNQDILTISLVIDDYYLEKGRYPDSLADVGMDGERDPWGNPYQYTKIEGCDTKGKGKGGVDCKDKVRKDKSLHPLNTDYDLYSMGEDGKSNIPLTAKASHDDIIRANNGKYFGLAEDY